MEQSWKIRENRCQLHQIMPVQTNTFSLINIKLSVIFEDVKMFQDGLLILEKLIADSCMSQNHDWRSYRMIDWHGTWLIEMVPFYSR